MSGKKKKVQVEEGQVEFTCMACQHVFTPKIEEGQGVHCPACGSSDQLSSRTVEAEGAKEGDGQ